MSMKLDISLRLYAGVRFDDAASIWVGWCPALDLYSQGETQGEAQKAVEEAVVLYVKNCYRRKILDDILMARGFMPAASGAAGIVEEMTDEFIKITPHYTHTFDFNVQLPLRAAQSMMQAAC